MTITVNKHPCGLHRNNQTKYPMGARNLGCAQIIEHILSRCLHSCVYYHHYADLSESIVLLKCLSGTLCLGCVSKINSNLSIIFHEIHVYGAVRIQLTPPPPPPPLVKSWNNDRRCVSFYIILIKLISIKEMGEESRIKQDNMFLCPHHIPNICC